MNRYESLSILQLSECASWREVQKAYKRQLVKWHPDKFNGSSLMASYTEEKCKVASEAFLCLKELYQQGVLPMRPVRMSSTSAYCGASRRDSSDIDHADTNSCDLSDLHQAMDQTFGDNQETRFARRPMAANWKRDLFLGVKERVCDLIGLILLPLEFALCLLKVIAGNVAVFSLLIAPLLSGYVAMNTLSSIGQRVEDVASSISVATMGSHCVSSDQEFRAVTPKASVKLSYTKLKRQLASTIQNIR